MTEEDKTNKAEDKGKAVRLQNSSSAGTIWFIGWMFTLSFAKLVWWKGLLGLLIWPYYLGAAIR